MLNSPFPVFWFSVSVFMRLSASLELHRPSLFSFSQISCISFCAVKWTLVFSQVVLNYTAWNVSGLGVIPGPESALRCSCFQSCRFRSSELYLFSVQHLHALKSLKAFLCDDGPRLSHKSSMPWIFIVSLRYGGPFLVRCCLPNFAQSPPQDTVCSRTKRRIPVICWSYQTFFNREEPSFRLCRKECKTNTDQS